MADYADVLPLASEILTESEQFSGAKKANPTLADDVDQRRLRVLGLLEKLKILLQDPREYLHEYVSSNWDHGALYAILQAGVLEAIPQVGSASINDLSQHCLIPESKLIRILRLLSCQHIVSEVEEGRFARTAVSELLVEDEEFKAWVEFQLFETRVASAHLSDTLAKLPNDYENGKSAFSEAWGTEMYEWHAGKPEKAERFRKAMRGVLKDLDPGDQLLREWVSRSYRQGTKCPVVEIGGRYGFSSVSLAKQFPELTSEIRVSDEWLLKRGQDSVAGVADDRVVFQKRDSDTALQPLEDAEKGVVAYIVKNMLWNWTDDRIVELLGCFLPVLEKSPDTAILVCDGISPARNAYERHIERAYRRRDLTTMIMHNAKQRNDVEWRVLFTRAVPALKVSATVMSSGHVCKCLYELRAAKG